MKTYQNLNNILHCLKVMADEEVCEECELYNLGDIHCREVARSAIELIKKQIPMKVETVRYYKFCCPVCGKEVGWEIPNYCERCGQRLEV